MCGGRGGLATGGGGGIHQRASAESMTRRHAQFAQLMWLLHLRSHFDVTEQYEEEGR